ncbi:Phosphatidylglycerophosphatase B [Lachnospiraceae bacterium TWA4]|nr:Phosphatidylglycerophosphatase B [Lachnospiraceae bacterium TWA4]
MIKNIMLDCIIMEKRYKSILNYLETHRKIASFLVVLNRGITQITYGLYFLLLFVKMLTDFLGALRLLAITAIPWILFSIVRGMINAPRPYEVYDVVPLIDRKSGGNSFPSRHVFSIFVIATVYFYEFTFIGVLLYVLGVLLAIVRVLTAVHFPKDVIIGAILGIVSIIGMYRLF